MSFPNIVYNSKTLDLGQQPYALQVEYPRARLVNRSASKVTETLNISPDSCYSFKCRWLKNSNATQATLKRNLYQFFEWAQEGGVWYFAKDASKTVLTTLSSSASAGASSVVVTSATGITVGQQYVLRSKTRQELIKVASVVGTTIGLTETLNNDFVSSSRFRDEFYWPARLIGDDSKHIVVERLPLWYDIEMQFCEDVNSL